jgi:hypothetical protein
MDDAFTSGVSVRPWLASLVLRLLPLLINHTVPSSALARQYSSYAREARRPTSLTGLRRTSGDSSYWYHTSRFSPYHTLMCKYFQASGVKRVWCSHISRQARCRHHLSCHTAYPRVEASSFTVDPDGPPWTELGDQSSTYSATHMALYPSGQHPCAVWSCCARLYCCDSYLQSVMEGRRCGAWRRIALPIRTFSSDLSCPICCLTRRRIGLISRRFGPVGMGVMSCHTRC